MSSKNKHKIKLDNGQMPQIEYDRSRNKLNLSHDDLNKIHELSQTNSTMADAVSQLLMVRKLLDDNIVSDNICFPTTWSVSKNVWQPHFDDLIDGSSSVRYALAETFNHFYRIFEENEYCLFEPLTSYERDAYYTWFEEISIDDDGFEFDKSDLDEVTE